jgi:hypothetical protein
VLRVCSTRGDDCCGSIVGEPVQGKRRDGYSCREHFNGRSPCIEAL